jgi:hypothetical protein
MLRRSLPTRANLVFQRTLFTTPRTMSENQYGQGVSHTSGKSEVPEKMQETTPESVEKALPDSVSHWLWYLNVNMRSDM